MYIYVQLCSLSLHHRLHRRQHRSLGPVAYRVRVMMISLPLRNT